MLSHRHPLPGAVAVAPSGRSSGDARGERAGSARSGACSAGPGFGCALLWQVAPRPCSQVGEAAGLGAAGDLAVRGGSHWNGTGVPTGRKAFCLAVPDLNPSCTAFGQSENQESGELM